MNISTKNKVLEVKNLNISFKNKSFIKDASFQVLENEVVLIQGPNGSGKSSILKTLLGEIKNNSVDMQYKGTELDYGFFRKEVAYIEQEDEIFLARTPIELAMQYRQVGSKKLLKRLLFKINKNDPEDIEDFKEIKAMFEYFNAEYLMEEKISKLSGGQKRLVSLIACFAREADLYILDEPINKLDNKVAKLVGDYISKLANNGKSVLLITHCRMYLKATKAYEISGEDIILLPKVPPPCDAHRK